MKKLYQVHMLPTDKIEITTPANMEKKGFSLVVGKNTNTLYLFHGRDNWFYGIEDCYTPQHLYITSDEEIKEGDYSIHYEVVKQAESDKIVKFANSFKLPKIVATNNPELYKECTNYITELCKEICDGCRTVAKIPSSFIEEYVKRQGIKEVMFEIENKNDLYTLPHDYQLKLTPSGEVIWSLPEQKTYTREEVCKLLTEFVGEINEKGKTSYSKEASIWFDKNYPK